MPARHQDEFSRLVEPYRRELQVHCYRMLASPQDAEDLVQETLLRAWQRQETFEGRASFRAWLYKIATNACLDALDRRSRRVLPMAYQPASNPANPLAPPLTEPIWLEPIPDDWLADAAANPEAHYSARESITLAFLAALQVLPPRQRAVLILCDVLDWRASEVAGQLTMTVSAVNSALHRARTTLGQAYHARSPDTLNAAEINASQRALLDRYVHAWETADVDELISLLKADATFPMPPSPSWYQGHAAIRAVVSAAIFTEGGYGRWRLLPIRANAQPAFALYQRNTSSGVYEAFGLQVLAIDGGQLADLTTFVNPALVARFGLSNQIEV